jgi:pyruvate formate lyase activating enzyme
MSVGELFPVTHLGWSSEESQRMIEKINDSAGLVFDIQGYSVHDGPGCRTTIFLAGCYLKCSWCCNPESWDLKTKVMFVRSKCQRKNGCLRCVIACEIHGVSVNEEDEIQLDLEKCSQCTVFNCSEACYPEALKICGRRYTAGELMRIINRDRDFWGRGGGVTFSGGEPFYQKDFLACILKKCKGAYIHTAIETTAHVNTEDFLMTMSDVDLAFIDVKHMDSIRHKEQTGVGNELILNNINALVKCGWPGRLILRMPVIEGFNDDRENINATGDFMDAMGLHEIDILPFHCLGDSKWEQLGKKYAYKEYRATPQEKMVEIQNIFLNRKSLSQKGIDIKLDFENTW